jgi:DNA-binding XRE family transcriptional regulator
MLQSHIMLDAFPTSQKQLIRTARSDATQAEFAKKLGVDRSCLSRYESEALGAPTSVINACLQLLAARASGRKPSSSPIEQALVHARQAVEALEAAANTTRGKR